MLRPGARLAASVAAAALLSSAVAAAQSPRDALYEARRLLAPECADGYIDSCEDLTRSAVATIAAAPGARIEWSFARLLLSVCRSGYDPACSAAVRVGERYAAAATEDSLTRGRKLLMRVCEERPAIGCRSALALATDLIDRPASGDTGFDMLDGICLAGESGACETLRSNARPDPHGAVQRRVGRIASYAGLGVAVTAAVGWGLMFSEDRCGTRAHRADAALLYAGCTVSYVGFALGTAASFVGTKLALNGRARGMAGNDDATGDSLFLWLGLGFGTLGVALPGAIELLRRDWRPVLAWSPLILGVAAQASFFVAHWLDPRIDDVAMALTPVPAGNGSVATTLGVALRY